MNQQFVVLFLIVVVVIFSDGFQIPTLPRNHVPGFKRSASEVQQICPYPKNYVNPVPPIDPNHPTITAAVEQAKQLLQEYFDATELSRSAISMAFVLNQTLLWSGGVGTMDFTNPSASAPDGDTIYRIASQTKVFTAFMLLNLRDAGLVNLDDSVMQRFPRFKLRNDPFGTNKLITFKHLASQLSGLPRESPCGSEAPTPSPNCTKDSDGWKLIAELVDPIWEPNLLPSYSNLGFAILGRSLQALSHCKYEEWVSHHIFKPIGMTSTGFTVTDDIAARMPTIPGPGDVPFLKTQDLGWTNPAGGAYSSVNDMAKWMMTLFHPTDDSIIKRKSVRESFTPQWNDFSGTEGFGLPYEMYFIDNLWVMTKSGGLTGYSSITLYVPELQLGVTLSSSMAPEITTSPIPLAGGAVDILSSAIESVIAEAQAKQVYPAPANIVSELVGCYQAVGGNVTVVLQEDGQLNFSSDQLSAVLYYRRETTLGFLFQVGMTQLGGCENNELLAYQGQYLEFQRQPDESFKIAFPTLFGFDIVWPRC